MKSINWNEAVRLKTFYESVVPDINKVFVTAGKQIICILITPADDHGKTSLFNRFLETMNKDIDTTCRHDINCHVIAVIKDGSSANQQIYFKTLDNIIGHEDNFNE